MIIVRRSVTMSHENSQRSVQSSVCVCAVSSCPHSASNSACVRCNHNDIVRVVVVGFRTLLAVVLNSFTLTSCQSLFLIPVEDDKVAEN